MGQMKKLWEQDVENAQCKAEDVIASLIPGNYQSDYQSEIVKYCEIAQDSNPRFDMIKFRDHIEKGLGWKVGK